MDPEIIQSLELDESQFSNHASPIEDAYAANYDSTSPRSGFQDSHSPKITGETFALQKKPLFKAKSPIASPNRNVYPSDSVIVDSLAYRAKEMAIVPPQHPKFKPLPYATGRSGLVYDVQMRYHREPLSDDLDSHPERADRITYIFNELVAAGLVPSSEDDMQEGSDFQLVRITPRFADPAEIKLVHSESLVELVEASKGKVLTEQKSSLTILLIHAPFSRHGRGSTRSFINDGRG